MKSLAIALALLSAVALAIGTQLQNGAVDRQNRGTLIENSHLTFKQLMNLLRRPQWVSGAAISAIALVLQFTALASITAIALCTMGLGAFVVMAHEVSVEPEIDDQALIIILGIALTLIAIFWSVFLRGATKFKPLTFIIGAGVLYGFVATLTKVVVKRLFNQGGFGRLINLQFELVTDGLTIIALLSMLAAAFLGGWFVQNAYTGPPDLVIAGLTVIDPLIAVSIGVVLLNEAMNASWPVMLGFVASGAVAVIGVYLLSKVHPELNKRG